ncbi:LysM peptidoglycan-binding domain-containing protein [Winogradskyella litoriviva]|uniref:LysM peptidoglycan-binding domain-containing protein n=1 Tax=Winogradskyella litoriviva TaxID=1220182 RepID=A0ABX2E494_9FLAO|nr:LysM peptidoglycan-binding domain-containing protein [Winogradskyella litoriviva]NRD22541.1 LysM peptidoglycan-binding domain-containing protein [Winogradskyella litoriviva]
MQRSYRLIISIFALGLTCFSAIAQETVEYKDVFLDGKPAKLNVATGEVKLVNPKDKVVKISSETTHTADDSNKHNHSYNGDVSYVSDSDFYIVKEGETLLDVSKKYNVSLTELKKANNLETTLINKGQRLRVNNFDAVTHSVSNTSNTYSETNYSEYYIVERGNTLFSLANQFNLSVSELKRINNLSSNVITIGQKLRIVESDTSSFEENNLSVYIVKDGDNLYRIALNNGTTVEEIKRLNGLTSNLITVGQKLQLQ